MKNSDISDPLFREAVEAIDTGDEITLKRLLTMNPALVSNRLGYPDEGYFSHPFLLWFVADNPIRHEKLPTNIAAVTRVIIDTIKREAPENLKEQLDYTLGLVATGRVPKESGVQIELMDLLIDEGATPGGGIGAIAHGNREAAAHLIKRGGKLTLTTAIALGLKEDTVRLAAEVSTTDKQIALMAASYRGNAEMISFLLGLGVDPNVYLDRSSGFHSHASALHQAVYSGSLEAVKVLVAAGARLDAKDLVYDGTPMGWADYMQREEKNEAKKKQYEEIEAYLREQGEMNVK